MSRRIPLASRDFQADQNGDDLNDGLSIESPLATVSEGLTRAAALTPAPSPGNAASVNVMGTGLFNGTGITTPDFVSVTLPNAAIVLTADGLTNVVCGSSQTDTFGNLSNSGNGGTILDINGASRIRAITASMVAGPFFSTGTNVVTAIKVRGSCDDIFPVVDQIECRSENTTLIQHTATSPTPIVYRLAVIDNFADGSTMFEFDPADADDIAVLNFSTLTDNRENFPTVPTNTTGIKAKTQGTLIIHGDLLAHVEAICVESGGRVDGEVIDVVGDIIVKDGGLANLQVITHIFGDVIVEAGGQLNGNIGGTEYGTWIDSGITYFNWYRSGGIPNSWDTFARLKVDSSIYELDSLESSFIKTTGSSRGVSFRLIDEDNSDVYYSGTTTTTSTGAIDVVMSVGTAFPSGGDVRLAMQVERASGGFSGIRDAASTLGIKAR